MPAPIVVEVYSPQPRPQELSALIAACTRAATPNECIPSDQKSSEPPLGVAIVRREGDRAHIELGLRGGPLAEWFTRDLVFQPGDDELERYRAIGFAIGTLVAKKTEPPSPEPAPPPQEPSAPELTSKRPEPPPSEPAPSPSRSRHRDTSSGNPRAGWAELNGRVGIGLIPGPPRLGTALGGGIELRPRGVFVAAEASYAERVGAPELHVRWLGIAAGLGYPLAPRLVGLGLDARLLLAIERVSFSAVAGERSASDGRWKPGAILALDAHWDFAPPVSLALGASSFVDPVHTSIEVGGERVGDTPALGLNGFVGLRLKLQ